jgi:hypothetical protein
VTVPAFRTATVVALFALALGACSSQDKPASETPPAAPANSLATAAAAVVPSATATAAAVAASAAAAVVTGDLPTSEDYEQKAQDEINPQNMETELDKLEKDIAK